ncbi:hypothetical protein Salmuc_04730 [Salipiger mucosus DSM 16094]|uniref:Uncharacterized protein n=1 Tax=Salipiger mucosus DSM 16094 TaxID=1123237 RepID=S9Q7F6_9RHOB|nr:hypothetical protein Salmuc_04730 [Salipiger mucosus DSM 16094]
MALRGALDALPPGTAPVVCVARPRDMHAVGEAYARFGQVEDDEVARLLGAAPPAPPAPPDPDGA